MNGGTDVLHGVATCGHDTVTSTNLSEIKADRDENREIRQMEIKILLTEADAIIYTPTTWISTQVTYLAPVHDNSKNVAEEAQRPLKLLPNRIVTNLGLGGGCVLDGGCTKLKMD
jgi:hypothetical protein